MCIVKFIGNMLYCSNLRRNTSIEWKRRDDFERYRTIWKSQRRQWKWKMYVLWTQRIQFTHKRCNSTTCRWGREISFNKTIPITWSAVHSNNISVNIVIVLQKSLLLLYVRLVAFNIYDKTKQSWRICVVVVFFYFLFFLHYSHHTNKHYETKMRKLRMAIAKCQ